MGTRWTPAQDARLKAMWLDPRGIPTEEIAAAVGHPRKSCVLRANTNGWYRTPEAKAAIKARAVRVAHSANQARIADGLATAIERPVRPPKWPRNAPFFQDDPRAVAECWQGTGARAA